MARDLPEEEEKDEKRRVEERRMVTMRNPQMQSPWLPLSHLPDSPSWSPCRPPPSLSSRRSGTLLVTKIPTSCSTNKGSPFEPSFLVRREAFFLSSMASRSLRVPLSVAKHVPPLARCPAWPPHQRLTASAAQPNRLSKECF